mmetsp:Transcript_14422/g.17392  ORF Transcript_14422/g.17392 Transcript_14422/m.17392 type:complete len:208 (-) Transcript_14422:119-742(-)|eukprot:CAMPEP_0195265004 /NCGR_PEP_ID=MMETSP0706-20130129/11178_1 /TAXON_ID=33640 /ORGANISM="Asterionellopsis glacialis, Strain CCMP134" /LENGTH=207 /DNA_ID=CAMNT_0040319365 /DNA_START=82 /DNA_END=705 /DNA_ORIENTATION=-
MSVYQKINALVCLLVICDFSQGFMPSAMSPPRALTFGKSSTACFSEPAGSGIQDSFDNILDNIKTGYNKFQESRAAGYDFKQNTAAALAGEYDAEAVQAEMKELIKSAPCVMFTWEKSPSCVKAVKYLDIADANVKIVRLDDPWDKGNPMRAELGKMVGQSSVPCIFIDGEYVGGFDSGPTDEAPGILDLAFKGTLLTKLKAADALK